MIDSKDKYRRRLRTILYNSSDVLPDEVSEYLLREDVKPDVAKDLLVNIQNYKPLVDHIPHQLVDFVLRELISKPSVPIDQNLYLFGIPTPGWGQKLGIRDQNIFFPASHIQGPFLYLLNQDENQGLRLVNSLINVATERWRHQPYFLYPDQPDKKPLPVILNLSSGDHEFWGNFGVYQWFRGKANAPNAVISALMALEVWMESQLENGRNSEELFEKVLSDSDCIAVVGVCLSIALAYPSMCLKAALPLVSLPIVWEMDISRYSSDLTGDFRLGSFLEGNSRWIYDLIDERNKRPQRFRRIFDLAPRYMHSELRIEFQQALEAFPEKLPLLTEGDRDSPEEVAYLRNDIRRFQAFGDLSNYRVRQVDNYQEIYVEMPKDIQDQYESIQARQREYSSWLNVYLWAEETIKNSKISERMTSQEAVAFAKSFQKSQDFITPIGDYRQKSRLEAIVGTATAIVLANFDWAKSNNYLEWSLNVFLLAAQVPEDSNYHVYLSDIKRYVAQGLCLLISNGLIDNKARSQVIRIISEELKLISSNNETLKITFESLRDTFQADPVLFWSSFSLCLSLSVVPTQIYYGTRIGEYGTSHEDLDAWYKNCVEYYLDNLQKNKIPVIPRIPAKSETIFIHDRARYGLISLPISDLCENDSYKTIVLQLCDDLIARTILDNLPVKGRSSPQDECSYTWNPFIFDWIAYLAKSLTADEIRTHILEPVWKYWSEIPDLISCLLNGYINHQIAYDKGSSEQALEIWEEICHRVLDSSKNPIYGNRSFIDKDVKDIFELIIFTRFGSCCIKDDWQHAHLFLDIFNKWVATVGCQPYLYRSFLSMLSGIGWNFSPEPTLTWLKHCTANFTYENWTDKFEIGRQTAEFLNRIWINHENKIRKNRESLKCFSDLVYLLVSAGIPLASILQKKLES